MLSKPQRNATRYGQAGENQWRGIKERVANTDRPRKSAAEKQRISCNWIVANDQNQDSADDKSGDDGDQRETRVRVEGSWISDLK